MTSQPTLTQKGTHLFAHSLLLIVAQKHTTLCGQVSSGVISTAGLSKFNIILKVFTPNTSSILLLQKATKR
jgi:hypothetical protein